MPWWSYSGTFNSWARVFTIVAPIRRPVKEPGPDINFISVISCQDLPFSVSLSLMNCSNCSARSFAKVCRYSLSFNFKMVSGVEVSKYNFIRLFPCRCRYD